MKLISMTDFVLQQRISTKDFNKYTFDKIQNHINSYYDKIYKYAKLLKQPLKLEYFIPCDENGNVLEEPPKITYFDPTDPIPEEVEQEYYNYDKAKEKVLFKGFEIFDDMYHSTKRRFVRNKSKLAISVYNRFVYHNGNIEETNPLFREHKTIEDLIRHDLELTKSAIKQLGL